MCFNWVLIWPKSDLTGAKLDIPLENDIQGGHFLTAPLQTLIHVFPKVFNEICLIFSMIFFRDQIF